MEKGEEERQDRGSTLGNFCYTTTLEAISSGYYDADPMEEALAPLLLTRVICVAENCASCARLLAEMSHNGVSFHLVDLMDACHMIQLCIGGHSL